MPPSAFGLRFFFFQCWKVRSWLAARPLGHPTKVQDVTLVNLADKRFVFPEDRAAPLGRVKTVSVCERLTQWNVGVCACVCVFVLRSQAFWLSVYLHVSWAERELPTNVSLTCFTGLFCLLPHWLTVS